MSALLLPPDAKHAEHVFDVVRGGFSDAANDVVALSWRRCLNEYRLHPDRPHELPVVSEGSLEERQQRLADVIDSARYEMTTLYQQLGDLESAVVLTDTDGVILHMVSSPEFAAEVGPMGLRPGAVWSETEAGTNGMGTCLASASPVAVRREDHFFTQFTGLTCSAVPVYDPAGELCAVLDISSRSSLMQQHLLVLLGMTARMIENRLIDRRFRAAFPLHFHTRPEFVYTLHEGRLAVDEDGRVLAANRSALFQLGLQSVADIRARRIDEIFQTSLEDMLQRSSASSYHPVVTYRANAAHRFFAVARRPAEGTHAVVSTVAVAPGLLARSVPMPRSLGRSSTATGVSFGDTRLAAALHTARRVIARQTPVLLRGETGSGKEVFARAVHDGSPLASGAFVAINCASLPESLIEAELFGYRAGAFTGAQRTGRRGKILQADGGTLFLDEIGDMPLDLQARLLRVLEERQVTPLGAEETHAVDFQLLSASHCNLLELVQQGRFREDLYYRLAGIELELPPLRERSDKRELIRNLLTAEAGEMVSLHPDTLVLMMAYAWPGNVRQLRHVLRSAAALADGGSEILPEHLPPVIRGTVAAGALPTQSAAGLAPAPVAVPLTDEADEFGPLDEDAEAIAALNPIQANERQVLLRILEQHRWNVSNVAKALDVSRNTLYRKLHRLHIQISQRCGR